MFFTCESDLSPWHLLKHSECIQLKGFKNKMLHMSLDGLYAAHPHTIFWCSLILSLFQLYWFFLSILPVKEFWSLTLIENCSLHPPIRHLFFLQSLLTSQLCQTHIIYVLSLSNSSMHFPLPYLLLTHICIYNVCDYVCMIMWYLSFPLDFILLCDVGVAELAISVEQCTWNKVAFSEIDE